ncbi:hypothetical protein YPPY92_2940, partial [Yersinia pestis PY-92]
MLLITSSTIGAELWRKSASALRSYKADKSPTIANVGFAVARCTPAA